MGSLNSIVSVRSVHTRHWGAIRTSHSTSAPSRNAIASRHRHCFHSSTSQWTHRNRYNILAWNIKAILLYYVAQPRRQQNLYYLVWIGTTSTSEKRLTWKEKYLTNEQIKIMSHFVSINQECLLIHFFSEGAKSAPDSVSLWLRPATQNYTKADLVKAVIKEEKTSHADECL